MPGAVKAITIVDGEVTACSGGLIGTADMTPTAVTPGTYTYSTVTVDASGRVTAAGSGTAPGGGTVTLVSVATANGFGGTVATSSTTPAITITTGITGLLKGDGTGVSAAVAGTDYLTPAGAAALYQPIDADLASLAAASSTNAIYYRSGAGTWSTVAIGTGLTFSSGTLSASAAGTVTAVSAGNLAPLFTTSVGTSTTTPAITFALSTQTANTVLAGPTTGSAAAPTFRALVAADVPDLSASYSTVGHTHTITLTGHVTGSGTGSITTTIGAGVVTNAMLAGSIDLATKVTGTLPAANLPVATQVDQEAATSTTTVVTPGRQHSHPSAAKAWAFFSISGTTVTVLRSYGLAAVNPVTRSSAGVYLVNFATAFSTTGAFFGMANGGNVSGVGNLVYAVAPVSTTQAQIVSALPSTQAITEAASVYVAFFGDQ